MAEFKLPQIGEGIESGEVLEVMIAEGDTVELEQEILELETDKATVFVTVDVAGTVSKVHFGAGDTINVGQTLLTVEGGAAAEKPAAPAKAEKPPEPEPEPAPEPEPTPEPAAEKPAPAPSKPAAKPAATPTRSTQPAPDKAVTAAASDGPGIAAGPAIRRFAREVGVDLGSVSGTGENNRITRDDVLAVVRSGAGSRSGSAAADGTAAGGETDNYGPIHTEKMPKIRQTIARKMHESWSTCPRVTNFDDADITQLEQLRQNSKQDYADEGVKLTTMPFLIKAVAMALKLHPVINASVDMDAGQIIYKDYINVGIAVDTERGLVVPSLRSADKMSIPEIARQLGELAGRVRENNFSIDELRGGTFTISNLGAIGGTYSTPIINTPETAIILVGRSRKMPVVVENDAIEARLMMPLSISYDHRLIDGGAAARFLNEVIGYLEAPSRLLLAL